LVEFEKIICHRHWLKKRFILIFSLLRTLGLGRLHCARPAPCCRLLRPCPRRAVDGHVQGRWPNRAPEKHGPHLASICLVGQRLEVRMSMWTGPSSKRRARLESELLQGMKMAMSFFQCGGTSPNVEVQQRRRLKPASKGNPMECAIGNHQNGLRKNHVWH
jgi:hypothetical protein